MSSPPSPAAPGRIGTRASNATKHPGLSKPKVVRRSSADVKTAALAKEAAKKSKKEAQQAGIKRVADFESMAITNEELGNATPRPNFAPRANLDSDSCRVSDGNNQLNDSDVDIKSTKTSVPKGKKKRGPAAGAKGKKKQLPTVVESDNDSEPVFLSNLKKGRVPKRPILEETDSDGFSPPLKKWGKSKVDPLEAAKNEPEGRDIPPSKKLKVTKGSDVDIEVAEPGKKKGSIRGAIASIQQETNANKRFGDGPQWSQRGKEGGGQECRPGRRAGRSYYFKASK